MACIACVACMNRDNGGEGGWGGWNLDPEQLAQRTRFHQNSWAQALGLVETTTKATTLPSLEDLEQRKKQEGLTWNELDPNYLKYEDRFGRTRRRARATVHQYVCPYGGRMLSS